MTDIYEKMMEIENTGIIEDDANYFFRSGDSEVIEPDDSVPNHFIHKEVSEKALIAQDEIHLSEHRMNIDLSKLVKYQTRRYKA